MREPTVDGVPFSNVDSETLLASVVSGNPPKPESFNGFPSRFDQVDVARRYATKLVEWRSA